MAAKQTAYEAITATIIAALEAGEVAWQKPWNSKAPCNAITGKAYRGVNPFLLVLASKSYTDNRWLTFPQAKELGGSVKSGEKGTWIVYSSQIPTKEDPKKSFWLMRRYCVFNIEQCENLEKLPPLEVVNQDTDPNILAEELVAKYTDAPPVTFGGGIACYRPSTDEVNMPNRADFNGNPEFYSTLFHEFAHSTGHEKRLNRKSLTEHDGFGGYNYSNEELVAEFAAAFMMAECGMDMPVKDNTVAYLQSWIKALKNDPTLVVKAASAAQKAADYMKGVTVAKDAEDTEKETVAA